MASGENKLFPVGKFLYHDRNPTKVFIFRTRKKARDFARDKTIKSRKFEYRVLDKPYVWGPEQ